MESPPLTWQQMSDALRRYALAEWGVDVPAVTFHLPYLGDNRKSLSMPASMQAALQPAQPVEVKEPEPPARAAAEQYPWEPWHTENFEVVCWEGTKFTFGPVARLIVKRLWEAWEANRPDVEQATLIRAAGSQTAKFAHLFANNPAWNTLIVKGAGPSTYRLAMRCASDPLPEADESLEE